MVHDLTNFRNDVSAACGRLGRTFGSINRACIDVNDSFLAALQGTSLAAAVDDGGNVQGSLSFEIDIKVPTPHRSSGRFRRLIRSEPDGPEG